jgi:Spy/CpxP family protein refolding chaperone
MGGNGNGAGGGKSNPAMTGGGAGDPVARLTEVLGLDDAQAAAVAAIFEDAQLLRDQEREQARLFAEEMRASIHEDITALLTPEQLALYEEHQAKRAEFRAMLDEMRQTRGGNGGGGRGTGDGTGGCTG